MTTTPMTRAGEEIWELMVPGRVHVPITSPVTGRPMDRTVKDKGQRLRINTTDRQLLEEGIRDDRNNPFRNGMLRQITGPREEHASDQELSDEQLVEMIKGSSTEEFEELLEGLTEVNVRRVSDLIALGPIGPDGRPGRPFVEATLSQGQIIKDLIARKYSVGGTTPTYEEMQRTPGKFA